MAWPLPAGRMLRQQPPQPPFPLSDAAKGARGCKLTKPMANHILGDIDRHVSTTVVHRDGVTHHLRKDHACTAPGADHLLVALLVHGLHSLHQLGFNVGALL